MVFHLAESKKNIDNTENCMFIIFDIIMSNLIYIICVFKFKTKS